MDIGINGGAGGDNQLSVVLGVYEPDVQCRGTIAWSEFGSCRDVVSDMPADQQARKFGPRSDPSVQVALPFRIDSCKSKKKKKKKLIPFLIIIFFFFFFFFFFVLMCILKADVGCFLTLFSTGDSDIGYWYRMWEVMAAVFSICIRAGEGGSVRGLGE